MHMGSDSVIKSWNYTLSSNIKYGSFIYDQKQTYNETNNKIKWSSLNLIYHDVIYLQTYIYKLNWDQWLTIKTLIFCYA